VCETNIMFHSKHKRKPLELNDTELAQEIELKLNCVVLQSK